MIVLDNLNQLPKGKFTMFVCKTLDDVECDYAYFHPSKKFYSCFSHLKVLTNQEVVVE